MKPIKLPIPRRCKCGVEHEYIPADAKFFADGVHSGWWWQCACGTTLYMPERLVEGAKHECGKPIKEAG